MRRLMFGEPTGKQDLDDLLIPINMEAEFGFAVRLATKGRCLIMSQNGFLGLAPSATTTKGDYICVLSGGDVPFLLRPKGEEFELLGECYARGIMDGEAVGEVDGRPPEFEDFVLV